MHAFIRLEKRVIIIIIIIHPTSNAPTCRMTHQERDKAPFLFKLQMAAAWASSEQNCSGKCTPCFRSDQGHIIYIDFR